MGGYRGFCPRRLFTSQLPRQVLNLKSMPLARYANAFKERDVANYTTGQRNEMAAPVGFEPTTLRLTSDRSAIEL
jgi:hypothetical protein